MASPLSDRRHDPLRRASAAWIGAVVVLAVCVLGGTILLGAFERRSVARFDQDTYHLPAVREFAGSWPDFDLVHYRSATTPLYHLALAAVDRFVSDDERLLRCVGAVFTIGLLVTVAWFARRPGDALGAAAVTLPILCSRYVFQSAAWVVPDNAGWWGVAAMLAIALYPRPGNREYAIGGAVLLLLVACRQVHVWAAALLWAAAWLGPASGFVDDAGRERPVVESLLSGLPARVKRAALAFAATLPAFLLVGWFAWTWGGLVPPWFRGGTIDPVTGEEFFRNSGGNLAAPAFVLAVFGWFAPFYLGYTYRLAGSLLRSGRGVRLILAAGVLAGAATALVVPTSYNEAAGRYSGLWNAARLAPAIADRSPVVVALAGAGGLVISAMALSMGPRSRWVFLVSIAGMIASSAMQFRCFQRYVEPFVLIAMAFGVSRLWSDEPTERERLPLLVHAGPVALAGVLGATTCASLL